MYNLTADQLIMINDNITGEKNKRASGAMNIKLRTILDAPFEKNGSANIYLEPTDKAARLGCAIIKESPFKSGNIKTAIIAALTFLEINGEKTCGCSQDINELAELMSGQDVRSASFWLSQHLNCREKKNKRQVGKMS